MKRINEPYPVRPGPTLDQLRYFLAAARTRNFTQAAAASFLSQSAFSRQIQALERALGAPLFERVGRHVRLNDAGQELERRAAEIVARADRLVEDLAPAGQGLRGTLRLGANMTIGIRLLPAWLAAFGQQHPGVHVTLLLRTTAEMSPLLRGEAIDCSVQETPAPEDLEGEGRLKVHFGFPDELWIVGPKGVDPGARPKLGARWFGIMDALRRRQLAAKGYLVEDATRVPAIEVALKFVEAGLGYAVVPGFLARASWKAGRITRLSATLVRRVTFVTLAGRAPSPCVQRLMDFLRPRWQAESERQRRGEER